jgi:phosphonopyruvate decarboxylase
MEASEICSFLEEHKISFSTGVPCSIFKHLIKEFNSGNHPISHLPATSEAEAIGIATGYYLSKQKLALVYMQNSGLANSVDPLTSLTNNFMYQIPMILFISWRGEPNSNDAVQHRKMGEITLDILDLLDIPYKIITENNFKEDLYAIKKLSQKNNTPVALVFKKGQIDGSNVEENNNLNKLMLREEAIKIILDKLKDVPIITNTGKISREVYEHRKEKGQNQQDFYILGSMGCVTSVALGTYLGTKKLICALDGDGSALMRLGSLAAVGKKKAKILHFILDNKAYDSTGGQPSLSDVVDWKNLLKSLNYSTSLLIESEKELQDLDILNLDKPAGIVVSVARGSKSNLSRPKKKPFEIRDSFIKYVR